MSNISVSKYYLYKFQSTQTLDQITAPQHPALSQYYKLIFFFTAYRRYLAQQKINSDSF